MGLIRIGSLVIVLLNDLENAAASRRRCMPEKPASIKLFKCVSAHFADAFVFSDEFPGLPAERLDGIQKRLSVGVGGQEIALTELLRKRAHGALYKYGVSPVAFAGIEKAVEILTVILHGLIPPVQKNMPAFLLNNFLQKIPPAGSFKGEKNRDTASRNAPAPLISLFGRSLFFAVSYYYEYDGAERSGSRAGP